MAEVLLFNIENQKLAFEIEQIERVIWAVEVTPTPKGPKCLLGIINMQGKVIPVVDMRYLLHLPKQKMRLSDQFLICKVGEVTLALLIDSVQGMYTSTKDNISSGKEVFPDLKTLDHVIKNEKEMILVYKWDQLIPLEEVTHSIKAAI